MSEKPLLSLSGIQHFAFCRRQWALIHIENLWAENVRTVEGSILHERAHDEQFTESRGNVLILRGFRVASEKMGLNGVCDVVEFHRNACGVSLHGREGLWLPYPAEYKRGKPKEDDCDQLQLCAQAMCLESMFVCDIPEGCLFYGELRRRQRYPFPLSFGTGWRAWRRKCGNTMPAAILPPQSLPKPAMSVPSRICACPG